MVAILGIAGGVKRYEFGKMTIRDVEDTGTVLIIRLPETSTSRPRTFMIDGKTEGMHMIEIYRKYAALRPAHTPHERLFVHYRNGSCSVQPIGINTFARMPSEIAKYLGLPDPQEYTGNCFRRTSTTLHTPMAHVF